MKLNVKKKSTAMFIQTLTNADLFSFQGDEIKTRFIFEC